MDGWVDHMTKWSAGRAVEESRVRHQSRTLEKTNKLKNQTVVMKLFRRHPCGNNIKNCTAATLSSRHAVCSFFVWKLIKGIISWKGVQQIIINYLSSRQIVYSSASDWGSFWKKQIKKLFFLRKIYFEFIWILQKLLLCNFAHVCVRLCVHCAYCILSPTAWKVIYSHVDSSEIWLYATVTFYMDSAWEFKKKKTLFPHAWLDSH